MKTKKRILSMILAITMVFGLKNVAPVLAKDTTSAKTTEITESTETETTETSLRTVVPAKVILSKTTYTYDGKVKKPSVKVTSKDGKTIPKNAYTVEYKNNKNAGTATVTVKVSETTTKYSVISAATLTKTFKIKAAKASKAELEKTTYYYEYKDHGIVPKVTVYDSNGKKISSKEYTVKASGNKKVGTAKVTIKMSKNYGSKVFTKKFTIKYDDKTNKLLPESKLINVYSDTYKANMKKWGYTIPAHNNYLYFTPQKESVLKKLLPYGDFDIEFDTVASHTPYLNKKVFFTTSKNADEHRQYNFDFELEGSNYAYKETKFTGTATDLIQCVIHSPIKEVETIRIDEYGCGFNVYCENGTEYTLNIGGAPGLAEKGNYKLLSVDTSNCSYDDNDYFQDGHYRALIKLDFDTIEKYAAEHGTPKKVVNFDWLR